jgi:toxin FitB
VSYVVLDTDVASAILRRRLPGSMEARLTGQSLAITFVTVGELTSWTLRRNWGAPVSGSDSLASTRCHAAVR